MERLFRKYPVLKAGIAVVFGVGKHVNNRAKNKDNKGSGNAGFSNAKND